MNVDTVVASARERVQAMLDDALDGKCKVPTDDDVARIFVEEAARELIRDLIAEHPEFAE